MSNVLPFKQSAPPKPLTRMDITRCTIYSNRVVCGIRAGFRIKMYGHLVLMVKP